ncbi:MAG: hypothetical protein WCZ43_08095 [Proteiniphilum sp.]
MKKISYILFSLFILSTPLFSQGEVDALRFSREDLLGTARAISMGGAFGALGGDLTGVSINPAGIAVYRSSEVTGTLDLSREGSAVGNRNANKTHFSMDNLGFVGYFPLRNDVMPLINFGFSYNKLKSFNKNILAQGNPNGRMIDYIAHISTRDGVNPSYLEIGDDLPDPFLDQNWLTVLGFNSYLINPVKNGDYYDYEPVTRDRVQNKIRSYEKGNIDNYDFTVGTTINSVLNLGMSLSIKDIYYDVATDLVEDFGGGSDYTLTNWLTVSGAGVGAKFGAIYRPVNSLRIGLAWHTPTWYALTETYEAQVADHMTRYVEGDYEPGKTYSAVFTNNYDLKTPGKIVASVATVLGNSFIASMDYEMVNYTNMKLRVPSGFHDDSGIYDIDNEYITEDHKLASTVKMGLEYRFTPQFSIRLGYAWMENPYDAEGGLVEFGEPLIRNSNTIFRIEGDTNYFTGGLGYRFNRNFYLDMAVVYKTQKDELYPFPNYYVNSALAVDATPFSLKNNSIRGLLTLGYRF